MNKEARAKAIKRINRMIDVLNLYKKEGNDDTVYMTHMTVAGLLDMALTLDLITDEEVEQVTFNHKKIEEDL